MKDAILNLARNDGNKDKLTFAPQILILTKAPVAPALPPWGEGEQDLPSIHNNW